MAWNGTNDPAMWAEGAQRATTTACTENPHVTVKTTTWTASTGGGLRRTRNPLRPRRSQDRHPRTLVHRHDEGRASVRGTATRSTGWQRCVSIELNRGLSIARRVGDSPAVFSISKKSLSLFVAARLASPERTRQWRGKPSRYGCRWKGDG
jgi:hypothetical protein